MKNLKLILLYLTGWLYQLSLMIYLMIRNTKGLEALALKRLSVFDIGNDSIFLYYFWSFVIFMICFILFYIKMDPYLSNCSIAVINVLVYIGIRIYMSQYPTYNILTPAKISLFIILATVTYTLVVSLKALKRNATT